MAENRAYEANELKFFWLGGFVTFENFSEGTASKLLDDFEAPFKDLLVLR